MIAEISSALGEEDKIEQLFAVDRRDGAFTHVADLSLMRDLGFMTIVSKSAHEITSSMTTLLRFNFLRILKILLHVLLSAGIAVSGS